MNVWLDGAVMPASAARIDPGDRGFTLGDGMFETIRFSRGSPAYLVQHLRRLRAGLAVIGLSLELSDDALEAAIAAVTAANGLSSAVVRLTVTRGPAVRGVLPPVMAVPTVLLTAAAPGPPLPPARVVISTITRRNEMSPLCRIKSLNYLDNILARQDAAARGADDALLLNTRGWLAEASAANLFVLAGGAVLTPPLDDGALPGVMRAALLERCGAAEQRLSGDDLRAADAVFLTSSLGLRPVAALDGEALGQRPDRIADLARRVMPA